MKEKDKETAELLRSHGPLVREVQLENDNDVRRYPPQQLSPGNNDTDEGYRALEDAEEIRRAEEGEAAFA